MPVPAIATDGQASDRTAPTWQSDGLRRCFKFRCRNIASRYIHGHKSVCQESEEARRLRTASRPEHTHRVLASSLALGPAPLLPDLPFGVGRHGSLRAAFRHLREIAK